MGARSRADGDTNQAAAPLADSLTAEPSQSAEGRPSTTRERWLGVHAIMTTPFNADYSVDWNGLRTNAEFLAESGADVLLCLGSEGEFHVLTDDERRRVVEVVAETVRGRRPVVAGVSHPSTGESVALALHASYAGCDAVMATPPYYGRPGESLIEAHYAAIGAADLPLFAYNSPARVGFDLSLSTIVRILRLPNVVGIKQAAPDMADIAELVLETRASGQVIIGGAETAFWPALCAGADGNTATAASAIPEVFARLYASARDGDMAGGLSLYQSLAPLRRAYVVAGGQAPVVKRLMDIVGLAGGPARPPAGSIDDSLDLALRQFVSDIGASRP